MNYIERVSYLLCKAPRRRKTDASTNEFRLSVFYGAKKQQVRFPQAAQGDTSVDWSGCTRQRNIETLRKFDDLTENGFTFGKNRSAFSGIVVQPFSAFSENGAVRCICEEFANVATAKSHVKRETAGRKHVID